MRQNSAVAFNSVPHVVHATPAAVMSLGCAYLIPTTIESDPTRGSMNFSGKSRLLHPTAAICTGIVETARPFDQHVQLVRSRMRLWSFVVDDRFVDDQGPTVGSRRRLLMSSRFWRGPGRAVCVP